MIEFSIHEIRANNPIINDPNSTASILSKLGHTIDKEKFYGTIIIKCEHGKPVYFTLEQRFTTDNFLKLINS